MELVYIFKKRYWSLSSFVQLRADDEIVKVLLQYDFVSVELVSMWPIKTSSPVVTIANQHLHLIMMLYPLKNASAKSED